MRAALVLSVALVACAGPRAGEPAAEAPAPSENAAGLRFIEDDWPRALAEARARNVPIFVDSWAPW